MEEVAAGGSKRFYCRHCEQEVSKSTLYSHKKLYYDKRAKLWSKHRICYDGDEVAPVSLHSKNTHEGQEDKY